MHILQLGKFYPVMGGVEKVAFDLTTGLSAAGVDCDMMSATVSGFGSSRQLNAHSWLICCHSWRKVAATMIAPSMITTLRARCARYDVIHVHHPDPMAALALMLSGYGGKVVCHWHSDILKQRLLLKLFMPLQSWLLRRADLIVGTSPAYIEGSPFLRQHAAKTVCLPIGVPAMRPNPDIVRAIRSRYAGRKIVFSLGRLVAYKGFTNLVQAAMHLGNDYVVLIGGTGALHDALQAEIEACGLTGRVVLLGRIPDGELASYYAAADLFCLSSVQKTEAFGIVQIEAMSCGTPVVATLIPESGVAWVNAHGVSGLNVEPGNPGALAEAIRAIAGDPVTRAVYSQGARRRWEELFTRDKMIENCKNIYSRLWN